MTRRPGSARMRALAALSSVAVVALAAAGSASAHAFLVRTVPTNGTSLRGAPQAITLEFDESVSSSLSRVSLVGAKTGPVVALRVAQAGGAGLSVELPRLPRDLYRVAWHTVSEDDLHPTGGTLVFGVDTAVSASPSNASTSSAPGAAPVEVALRWVDFTGIAVLIGVLATLLYVLPAAARRGARRLEIVSGPVLWLAIGGCITALVSGGGLLVMQVGRAGGATSIERVLTGTGYGHAWIVREAILVLLACGLLALRRSPASRGLQVATAVLGIGLVVPLALVSHAASMRGSTSVATAVLAVHILAAAMWVGGVAALCLATVKLVRAGERAAARALALSFGELAVISVALLTITGIAVLGIHVRSLDALVSTGYGKTLIVKTALFLLAGAVGLATTVGLRWRHAPGRLRAAWAWAPRLESAVLVAVLVPAALLTASAPARESVLQAQEIAPLAAAKSFANADDLVLSVAVEPNRAGQNFITVTVNNTRRPAPAPIRAVTLSLSGQGTASRNITLAPTGTDQWQAVTKLRPGKMEIEVAVKRPRLPDTTTTTAWAVSSGSLRPVERVKQIPAAAPGIMQRPLEPILKPIAIGGAVLLLLLLGMARIWRSRLSAARPSVPAQRIPGELQPRRAGR